ncbi:polygalacturonase-like [Phoenix dactylifera]|uniref:Exopolygalacturonase n=1 Tax=Phoenix dactylifera TaxID=42345 RepID=A0A8B7D5P8_PHODC|nr:polygalacturonase-like [Phoenix dactylifera]
MAQFMAFLLTILFICSFTSAMAAYNIADFGAKPDGRTDSAKPFLSAWAAACGSSQPSAIIVPAGRFLLSQALFQGPCKNSNIRIFISGTIVAPSGYGSNTVWISFNYVQGLSIFGGTLDGQGQSFWACKMAGRSCPNGATSLTIAESKNILISGLTLLNSEVFHISIFGSSGVTVRGAKITAPGDSPNTDGIHIQKSSFVTVSGSSIKTGDDCISMGEGATDVWIEKISCGPGHGISIGSLGDTPQEDGVQNVTVKSVVLAGTQNGLRIKTWGKPNTGFVKGIRFEHAIMQNVQNPIVIDQNYCPGNKNCPGQSSGIKISQVMYSDIHGSSATQAAVKFDCSSSNPCSGIGLQNINLSYLDKQAQSYCRNVQGSTSGFVIPPSCL